jgi:hypothetical protein
LLGADDGLDSFVVRTDAEYESLTAKCDGIRKEWLPPRPGREQEVEGGFQGACEMLITRGAWALVPKTTKPARFEFSDVLCPDDE